MDTIILDWGALSQIVQQGGALEQALRTSGSNLAITNYGFDEIPAQFLDDYNALATRLNIQTIDIEANLTADTLENRQLGVVFDANGNATGQLGDASYRWLEQNGGGFSNGTYRLLANERGLISEFSDIAPNSMESLKNLAHLAAWGRFAGTIEEPANAQAARLSWPPPIDEEETDAA